MKARTILTLLAMMVGVSAAARAEDKKPSVSFFGMESTETTKVVFVLDHSSSMKKNYDYMQEQVSHTIGAMTAAQSFLILACGNTIDGVFPPDGKPGAATVKVVQAQSQFMSRLLTRGNNDGQLEPFAGALKRAFAVEPQAVYLLIDGSFDAKLADVAKELNDKRVEKEQAKIKIFTIGFWKIEAKSEEALKKIAEDSGGAYHPVSEREVTR